MYTNSPEGTKLFVKTSESAVKPRGLEKKLHYLGSPQQRLGLRLGLSKWRN